MRSVISHISYLAFLLLYAYSLTACEPKTAGVEKLSLNGCISNALFDSVELNYLSFTSTIPVLKTGIDQDGYFDLNVRLDKPGIYSLKFSDLNYWIFLLENNEISIQLDGNNASYASASISTSKGKDFADALFFIEQTKSFQDSINALIGLEDLMTDHSLSQLDFVDSLVVVRLQDRIEKEENPFIIAYLLKWIDTGLAYEFMGSQIERLKLLAPDLDYTHELVRKYELLTLAVEQEKAFKQEAYQIDSSIYLVDFETVKIGNQLWMAENLNIPTPNSWCLYDDDENCKQYGRMYNWFDAQLACPPGWRLPSDEDWIELEMFLGMQEEEAYIETWRGENVGGKLKSTDKSWDHPNVGATNSTGFNALPCGPRNKFGMYGLFGHNVIYWTSTPYGEKHAVFRYLGNSRNDVGRSNTSKYDGFYVRCVKDIVE